MNEVNDVSSLFPADKVYFSDDIAILPGDGEVVSIGDPRANWNAVTSDTSEEGFRPLFLHRAELNHPDTKAKIEAFIAFQKQHKDKLIAVRVRSASYVTYKAQDKMQMFQYLTGEAPSSTIINSQKEREVFLDKLYQTRNAQMTSDKIIAAAKNVVQRTERVPSTSKRAFFAAINKLSNTKSSQPLVEYFGKRRDFVMLAHPEKTVLPSLLPQQNSGQADFQNNMIRVAGTSKYDVCDGWGLPFFIQKDNTVAAPHIYGGYAYYKVHTREDYIDFSLDYARPLSQHGLQKIESLVIEELSDFMSFLLSGKDSAGKEISGPVKRPQNAKWLTVDEEVALKDALHKLSDDLIEMEKLVQKVKNHETLNAAENLQWASIESKIAIYEESVVFQPRHIVTHAVPPLMKIISKLKAGDKVSTDPQGAWKGEALEVVSVIPVVIPGQANHVVLHLKASAIEKDHQLHTYLLEDIIFQFRNALAPGEVYAKKIDWLPKETIGRLRGVMDNYPLAKEWMADILPFFDIIDKNVQLAIEESSASPSEKCEAVSRDSLNENAVCPIEETFSLPAHAHEQMSSVTRMFLRLVDRPLHLLSEYSKHVTNNESGAYHCQDVFQLTSGSAAKKPIHGAFFVADHATPNVQNVPPALPSSPGLL